MVKLPCSRLDQARDCNHVLDDDLRAMFGEKVKYKGYQYCLTWAEDVKAQVEELYKVVYQCKKLPTNGYFTESSLRAVLFEVYNQNRMNWALFATDRWVQKKFGHKEGNAIVYYKEKDLITTYDQAILKSIEDGFG